MRHGGRTWVVTLTLLAGVLAALPAASQTVLLVVRENVDSSALPPPLPVREGVSDGLFQAGVIVLDAPGAAGMPAAAEAARLARSAGAEVVLEIAAAWSDTRLGADLLRMSARAAWTVFDAESGRPLGSGTAEATNRDREKDVDRLALGGEIGRKVADEVKQLLDRRGS